MGTIAHTLIPEAENTAIYRAYPHEGDCTETRCAACGCCIHCAEDGHCEGTVGCLEQECGCIEAAS